MYLRFIGLLFLSLLTMLNAATPIASYHFDEPGWDNQEKAFDSSREKNHIPAYNGVTRTNIGQKVCESAEFNGTNQYMALTGTSTSNSTLFSTMCSFFISSSGSSESFWFKTADTSATFIAKELTAQSINFFHQQNGDESQRIYIKDGKICSKTTKYSNSTLVTTSEICSKNTNYDNNAWYHVAHTTRNFSMFLFSNSFELLYIHDANGALLEELKQSRPEFGSFSSDSFTETTLMIGVSQEGDYYTGLIDEVNIYNDTISENEVTNLVNENRACATATYVPESSAQFDAWESSILTSNPDTNISARKIYTKIVNSANFELNVSKVNGTIPTGTEINVTMKVVPTSSCPNGNNDIMNGDTGVVTWKSGDISKLVTFSSIPKAHRDASIMFEINTTATTTGVYTKTVSECDVIDSYPYGIDTSKCTVRSTTTETSCTPQEIKHRSYSSTNDWCLIYLNVLDGDKCYEKIECSSGTSTESNITKTCSSDNFAIRPDHFSSPTFSNMQSSTTNPKCLNPKGMVAGCDYKLIVEANGSDGQHATGYDQVFANTHSEISDWFQLDWSDSNLTYVLGLKGTSGEFIHNTINDTNFSDGYIADVNYSYSDVGQFNVSMVDRDWAKVDITDNDPNATRSVIMTTQKFKVVPYEFNISVNELRNADFNTETNLSRFTYLSNTPAKMGARGRIQVDALNARGERTLNYATKLYENSAKMYIKVPDLGRNLTMSFGNGNNNWYTTSNFIPFVQGSLYFDDPNSAHFNYERNATNYDTTPFRVKGVDIDVNITDSDNILYQNGSFSHPEGNATFFYSRINAINNRVLSSNREKIGLFVEIYCNNDTTDCSAYDVNMTNSPTDIDWYLHYEHNESTVEKFHNITLEHPRLGIFTDLNITNLYGDKESSIGTYFADVNNSFIYGESNVEIEYNNSQRHTTHIRVTPSEWLEHTSKYRSPIFRFKVTFPGGEGGDASKKNKNAGMGVESEPSQHIESNSSLRSTKRINW